MRHGRLITTVLAALAAMTIAPAWAAAAPASFTDDSAADFNAGVAGAGTSVVSPGSVRLLPAIEEFNGTDLPAGLTATPSGVTVAGGSLNVDGGRVNGGFYQPAQVLAFRATFSSETFEQVGFADTLTDGEPWALFSIDNGAVLRARTTAGGVEMSTVLAANPTGPHNYRIEWTATDVKYYVDDFSTPVATHAVAIAGPLRPVISDPAANGIGVSVDSLGLLSGAFESAVHDLGEAPAAWNPLTTTIDRPAGTQVVVETRSGQTATPDATWSAYQSLGAGNAIQSPLGRYLQYRAKLTTTDAQVTPSLDIVQLDYSAPTTSIAAVQVTGTAATVSFSSPAADVNRFECRVDGGAFATCLSPLQLGGLAAGAHTVSVRAVDNSGNTGDADTRAFTVDSPPANGVGGGTTQQPSGGSSSADTTAPKVSLVAQSLRVSKKGTVSFRVGCPKTETSCKVTVQIKRGSTTAARKTVTVKGGKTVIVTLQLTKATRLQLTKHSTLKVSTVVAASDAAGNRKTTTQRVTLRAPAV